MVVLAGLSAFAPVTTDLYLPALPRLGRDLGVTAASVEVTLTMCVVGIAVGQLLVGPLSDTLGRRRPLLAGLALFIASSLGCAAAPSIAVLDVLRLLQGISGATGIVIARAMVRDMYSGVEAARLYATLGAIIPLAPILAPTVGGAILLVTSWRGIFAVQAGVGAVLLAAAALITHETLDPAARHPGSVRGALATYRDLLHSPRYSRVVAAGSLGFAAFFAYISASSFVYQDVLGFSAQAFGLLFAVNGIGLLATNVVNARLVRSVAPERLLLAGLANDRRGRRADGRGRDRRTGRMGAAAADVRDRVQHGTDHVQLDRRLDGAREPPRGQRRGPVRRLAVLRRRRRGPDRRRGRSVGGADGNRDGDLRRRRAGDRPPDYPRARLDAGAVAQPARTGRRKRHGLHPRDDLIGQRADALHRQRHDVAGRERRPLLPATP